MAKVVKSTVRSTEQIPHMSYDAKLARQVLKAYADDGELSIEECSKLGLNDNVAEGLRDAMNDDGILDEQERGDLYNENFVPRKFIWMLAGTKDGSRPVKMRVRNLIADLEGGNYRALWELKDIGPYAEEAIPAVVDTLRHGLSLYFKQKKWDELPGIVYVPPISIGYCIGKNIVDGQGNGEVIVKMATDALGAIGDGSEESATAVLEALHRVSDWRLKLKFVTALGRMGAKGAVGDLVDILCDERKPTELRTAAAKALGQIGAQDNPRVIPALKLYSVHDREEFKNCSWYTHWCADERKLIKTARNALRALDE